ncbi:MAG TPA: ATP synthase subunit I [Pseudomonadales bacterium]|nr:ATP synthase subunit I [Pseudomonadales bacterium]
MANAINQKQRQAAYRTLLLQCLVAVIIVVIAHLRGENFANAVLVGATISLVANAYFTFKVFRYAGIRQSQQMVKSFYAGEAGKFVIILVSFAVAFKLMATLRETQNAFALLMAFSIVYVSAWLGPLLLPAKK